MKVKVTIFHCGFIYTGGGERIVIEEVLELRKRGYEVSCFAPTFDPQLCYPDIIGGVGIKTLFPQLPAWFPYRFAIAMVLSCLLSPFLAWRFRETDVFLGANQPGAFLAWVMASLLRKPYLIYLNQPNRVLYPRDDERWLTVKDYFVLDKMIKIIRPLVATLDWWSIKGARRVLINGGFIAREICQVYQLPTFVDCPGGAHPKVAKALRSDRFSGSVSVVGRQISKPYVLLVSRHEFKKRFDWAIEALGWLVKKAPEAKLVIPGPANCITENLVELAKNLGLSEKVLFLGRITQKELEKLYTEAAVSVFPSPREDLGLVVLEAMARETPVVAWDDGGPTVTVVDGETGLLAKPYSVRDLAKKMGQLMSDEKLNRKMGVAAGKHIREAFSWKRHTDILERELGQIIKEGIQ